MAANSQQANPMILYTEDSSPWCAPVRAAIYAKGLEIEMRAPPGGFGSGEYRALRDYGDNALNNVVRAALMARRPVF